MDTWMDIVRKNDGMFDSRSIMTLHVQSTDGEAVMLLWGGLTNRHYAVVQVSPAGQILEETKPIYGGQDALDTYMNVVAAVLYRSENMKAPVITYAQRNTW